MKNNEPYSYMVSFYTSTTSLKDLFGEDTLNDLDLSALDHAYNDTNIEAGIAGYVAGTSSSIIYPMITPVTRWLYNSQGGNHDPGNIHWHNDTDHGVFWYELKPAVKLTKIIDAIEEYELGKIGVNHEAIRREFYPRSAIGGGQSMSIDRKTLKPQRKGMNDEKKR